MNVPFVIAQAATSSGTSDGAAPIQTIKILKPDSGQAAVFHLSASGPVKIDLSAIADEKITLVHVGNDLIILFDNNTTATLDNFFDGTNPMPNVYVEVGDGRELQSTVFASQFPVTTDPSVLPAAGDNGDSGHPFPGPEVDPLNGWGPLALQPGEELPNWQTTSFRLNDFINDHPSFGDNANVLLDEDFLEQSNGAPFNGNRDLPSASPGDNDGGASFSGIMHYNFRHDGPAATDPLVIDTASLSGLGITSQGSPVVFDWNSTTFTLTGYVDSDATPGLSGGDKTVLTLQFDAADVTAAGDDHHFSVTLLAPLDQAPGGEENNWMLPLQITITDSNNDAVTGTVNLDIDDDMPVMGQGDRDWTLDEDVLTNGNDALDNPADPNDYTLIANKNLGVNWGADGPGALSFAQTDATHPIITITDQNGNPVGPLQSNGVDLIYSIATNADGGQTLTATAGGNPIFTLTLDPDAGPNGTFTFNLQGHLDHPNDDGQNRLDLNFGFTANDHDHDPVDSSIVIRITDDVPYVIGRGENVSVNENDIVTPWSLGTSPGDGHTEPGSGAAIATGSLSGLVATGVDTPITWGFSADAITTMEALGLFSKQTALPDNGQGLTYTVTQIGGDMVLSAFEPATPGIPGSGNIVFSFTLDQQTGDFTFRLFDELIHVAGDGTNTDLRSGGPTDGPGDTQASIPYIDFGSIITATDFDGDSVTLTDKVHVTVVDDIPQVQIGVDPLGVVQHDETPGVQNSILQFPPDLADSDTSFSSVKAMFTALEAGGQTGDDPDVSGTGAIGYAQSWLPVVFNADLLNLGVGADSPPQASTFSLQVTNGAYSGVQTTEGVNVYLYNENGLIVGRLGGDSDATPDQPDPNGLVAFAIAIEPDGKVDLAQYLSLNHPTSSDDDESISLASGSVRAVLSVTDSDGDTVTDSADISGHIRFDDDGPNVGRNPTVKVDDDVLDGNPSGPGDDADAVNTVGTLSHNYGSDGAGSTLLLDTGAPSGFVYAVSDGGTVLHISQNGIEVLRVTLTDTTSGNYEVEQLHAIDHPNGHNENNDTFNIAYRVTDGDGDHVNGRLTINVDDDTPVPLHVTSAAGEVFEDGLTGPLAFGNPEGAPGSQPTSIIITSAQLAHLVSLGADVPGTFSLISSIGGNVKTADGVNVTSGGVQVKYAHAGADIIGYADVNSNNSFGGGDHEVFRLHDLGGGSFQFTLEGALDHLPLNAGGGDSETLILNLAAAFRATDHDGDSTNLGGVLAVSVENDVPLVVSDTTNYATNGDFTQGNWTPPAFWGSSATPGNVPGWNIGGSPIDPPVSPPDNAITFERQANGFLGLFTSNGADMIDLGASGGNYELSQNVGAGAAPDLAAGQPYVIQFEAGAPFPETALLEVLWNNQVIGTIDTNVHTGQLEKYAFTVEGTGDPSTDKLTFREVGTGNLDLGTDGSGNDLQDERYHGTYIANVEIVAANGVVDEDGLNTPLSVGNGDSDQIGDAPGNSATVTGNLGVQWGADSTDTPDAGGVQDGAGSGLTGRTLTFADNLVETFGTLALTSAGDAVSFQLQDNGTKLVGVAGSDDRVVFTVTLSDDGTGAFTFTLFDQLDHAPGANENDIALKFHFTATDFDGDAANGSFIVAVDDDMPVLAVESSTEAIRNLALALDETVQPDNATNDPTFDHFNGAETESGGGAANGGADDVGGPLYNHTPVYDLNPNANQAIGSLTTVAGSLAALFTVTPHYGADGPGAQAINSLLSLGLTGGTSLATTLTATALAGTPLESMTDAERAILLVQNGDAIEGRIAGTSASGDEYVVFRISLNNASDPAQAQLAIDQFLPIDHGGTEDPSVFDEVASLLTTGNGSVTLTDTVTITDGDNDQATTSSSVNLITGNATIVTFDDDGPVPAALSEVNLVNNGLFFTGFVENGNVWGAQSGVANGTAGDWIVSPSGGGGATQLERVGEPYGGADSPTNSLIVDLEATPGNVQISQDLHGLVDGGKYLLTFEVGEANFGNAKLEVIWNGTVIATIDPNPGLMQTVALELEASGPSGTLTFKEIGTAGDNTGTYLANVHVTNVVIIDETPGVDADSNDTTDLLVKALFQNVDHPGSDPDMSPQFATGIGAVVNVAAPDYGTDGPAAQQALQYGLHVANAASGLTTTENQSIELFVEDGIIVGRYDSDGSGSVTADDNAAFAIAIDADTGVLSVAQYVSLHHPDTGKADEGIQLAAGTIAVDVTLTDGDGDKTVSSADISNHVLFQDDGPAARYSGRLTVQEDAASDGSFIVQTRARPLPVRRRCGRRSHYLDRLRFCRGKD